METEKTGILNKAFNIVINNPSITFSLVGFLIISNFLAVVSYGAQTKLFILIFSLCVFALFICFLSGWFQIIKESTDIEKIREKNYLGIFFDGVGKNIIPVSIGSVIYFLFMILFFSAFGYIAHRLVGSLDFAVKDLASMPQNDSALIEYLKNLPADKLTIIISWQLSLITGCMLFNFLFMFYSAAIIYNEKNNVFLKAFIALYHSVCFVFKHFLKSIGIFIFINLFLLIFSILGSIYVNNEIIKILLLFIYVYFISFSVVLIFGYYEKKCSNCCNNGCNGIRENEADIRISEKN